MQNFETSKLKRKNTKKVKIQKKNEELEKLACYLASHLAFFDSKLPLRICGDALRKCGDALRICGDALRICVDALRICVLVSEIAKKNEELKL